MKTQTPGAPGAIPQTHQPHMDPNLDSWKSGAIPQSSPYQPSQEANGIVRRLFDAAEPNLTRSDLEWLAGGELAVHSFVAHAAETADMLSNAWFSTNGDVITQHEAAVAMSNFAQQIKVAEELASISATARYLLQKPAMKGGV